jgi:hypothetical protein
MSPEQRRSFAKALRVDMQSLAQGGLAFIIAYTVMYFVNAM